MSNLYTRMFARLWFKQYGSKPWPMSLCIVTAPRNAQFYTLVTSKYLIKGEGHEELLLVTSALKI